MSSRPTASSGDTEHVASASLQTPGLPRWIAVTVTLIFVTLLITASLALSGFALSMVYALRASSSNVHVDVALNHTTAPGATSAEYVLAPEMDSFKKEHSAEIQSVKEENAHLRTQIHFLSVQLRQVAANGTWDRDIWDRDPWDRVTATFTEMGPDSDAVLVDVETIGESVKAVDNLLVILQRGLFHIRHSHLNAYQTQTGPCIRVGDESGMPAQDHACAYSSPVGHFSVSNSIDLFLEKGAYVKLHNTLEGAVWTEKRFNMFQIRRIV